MQVLWDPINKMDVSDTNTKSLLMIRHFLLDSCDYAAAISMVEIRPQKNGIQPVYCAKTVGKIGNKLGFVKNADIEEL